MKEKYENTVNYIFRGVGLITLIIFFALLYINNAGVRVVDLEVGDILFALFWLFIIYLTIIGILVGIIVALWLLVN